MLPYVANMSYFWDTFGPVHKIPENSAPVLVGEAGASVHAQISHKMYTSNKQHQTLDDSESGVWTSKRLRRNYKGDRSKFLSSQGNPLKSDAD